MDSNYSIVSRKPEEIHASRPGPIAIIILIIAFGIVFSVGNWSTLKSWFG